MKCMSCKNGMMTESITTYIAKSKSGYVIIENVPCMKCIQCGDEVFSASVVEKIEALINEIEKMNSKIMIVDFAA